jgi:very-short-patch-repair endonuclease
MEIENIDNDDYSWPMSINNLCKNFDLNRHTIHSHKRKYLTNGEDYFIEGSGSSRSIMFEKSGAIKILMHYRTEKGVRYLRKHGYDSFSAPKEEHLYINTIKYAINGFDIPKKGSKVKTLNKDYKIDLYLQKSKLAIECDEHDHYGQEYEDELLKREEDISKGLGCRFLRFNPQEPDFNVGEVINVIFHYIFNKLIKGKDPIDYYMEKRKRAIRERKYPILTEEQLAEFE